VSVHPETVVPGAAGDVDLRHPIEPHAVDSGECSVTVIDRVAPHVMQVQQLLAASSIQDRVHQPDVVADLRIGREVDEVMGGILQQEWHAVARQDGGAAIGDQLRRLLGRGDRQRHAGIERVRVLAGDGLEAQMLAVPEERPAGLKAIE
jgi:hypothetical protein